ncbi:SAM-dependent methyltransferase [Thermomonas sp.]|uniref:class I SAM-dependent methyltransferase n=2 Tax=Thermomonas sp. TaxID=1971895 RepID=UPI001B65C0C4|nr:SAM-dependent methyltransferase [Thermomonas sp.]MBK6417560.1 SAM-dependent methyltransferase [Thermomonas sp.]MBK6925974.1 SAM-dependent methyltransferase [Thermomonas sp.]MBK7205866.1 SAM-dependent methyltransferase [Thermomonas sp.]MBL0228635.1 SAM-dependent methyltransferase [Thermomonas sp.]MBP8648481.1 SAM-dependent methyltransferase [Thermomonas sp.]
MQTLPPPADDAIAHSAHLREIIQEQLIAAGGSLPFWKFMELALYAPGLGYYSAGATKFGRGGDFVTAPEVSPLFAACVADALTPVLRQLGPEAQFMEIGGGSGAFAETALAKLLANDALPARYAILEPSADLRERQRERLQSRLPPLLFELVEWLDGPIQDAWNGVLFANEVIDALPTPRFSIRDGEVFEEHVALDGEGRFLRTDRPADPMLAAAVRHVERQLPEPFAEGYRSEVLAQLPYWLQAVAGGMGDGAMLFVDYGHGRGEYYQPQRRDGTLRAFRQHHVVADVFAHPGLQDITASVDFTALAEAGVGAGFEFAGYCSQASFLLGNRLQDNLALAESRAADELARHNLRQQVKLLTLPSEMGERFQAIGFQRGVELGAAFLAGDLSHRL